MGFLPDDILDLYRKPATTSSLSRDEDLAIRTIIGEAKGEGPRGWEAVGGVIRNRSKQSGKSLADVVLAPGQFEPWGSRRKELEALDPQSQTYRKVAETVLPILRGERDDPTSGATHFYSPGSQAALGRKPPSWDNGSGLDIGNHRFFKLGYKGGGRHGTEEKPSSFRSFTDVLSAYGAGAPVPVETAPNNSPATLDSIAEMYRLPTGQSTPTVPGPPKRLPLAQPPGTAPLATPVLSPSGKPMLAPGQPLGGDIVPDSDEVLTWAKQLEVPTPQADVAGTNKAIEQENIAIRGSNAVQDLELIGEAAKSQINADEAFKAQAEVQKQYETRKTADPTLTPERFNAEQKAEVEAKNAQAKETFLKKNSKFTKWAEGKKLDPFEQTTQDAYNAQLPKGQNRIAIKPAVQAAATALPQVAAPQTAQDAPQAIGTSTESREIPDDFIEGVQFRDKPDNVSNKDWFIQNAVPKIAARGYDAAETEAVLRDLDLESNLDYGTPLSKVGKEGFFNFRMTPEVAEKISGRSAAKYNTEQKTLAADADFQDRIKAIAPEVTGADRDLEEFRQRGLADIDAGLIEPGKAVEAYDKLKADIETWKNDKGFLGVWDQKDWVEVQRFLAGSSNPDRPASETYLPSAPNAISTPQEYLDKAYADMRKQYGTASNWKKAQQEYKKRFEKAPMTFLAKGAEAAVGGAMQVPFQGAAAALETIAIASEGIERATGGLPGDAEDPAAEKKATYKLAQDIRSVADAVKVDKDFKGGYAELAGNVFGQIIVQTGLGILTGGAAAPAAFGAAMGASDAFKKAGEAKATPWQKLGAALVGAGLAAPDYFIFKGMFKAGNAIERASILQNLKATVERGLVEKGTSAIIAEKAAAQTVDGFLAEMVAKGGWREVVGKTLQASKDKAKIGIAEGIQEPSESMGNDLFAYATYDPSPERWQKAVGISGDKIVEGVAGFFGALVGATLADMNIRAAGLSPGARAQADELLEEYKETLPKETYEAAKTALELEPQTGPDKNKKEPVIKGDITPDEKAEAKKQFNETKVNVEPAKDEKTAETTPKVAASETEPDTVATAERDFTAKGGNKVVDEKGEPLTVYHGTNVDFETHDSSVFPTPGYFAKDPAMASYVAGTKQQFKGGQANVRPTHLDIKNPVTLTHLDGVKPISAEEFLASMPFNVDADFADSYIKANKHPQEIFGHIGSKDLIQYLKGKGYDGIVFNEGSPEFFANVAKPDVIKDVTSYVPFDVSQIKSALKSNESPSTVLSTKEQGPKNKSTDSDSASVVSRQPDGAERGDRTEPDSDTGTQTAKTVIPDIRHIPILQTKIKPVDGGFKIVSRSKGTDILPGVYPSGKAANQAFRKLQKEQIKAAKGTKTDAVPPPVEPDGYVNGRPVVVLAETPGKVKVQYLDGRKETPSVRRSEFTASESTKTISPAMGRIAKQEIVKRALTDPITDIGQLTPAENKYLKAAVAKGILKKGSGGGFPQVKTVYAAPDFDIDAAREKGLKELSDAAAKDNPKKVTEKSVPDDAPSENTILGYFAKSGPWNKYSRRFHNLAREGKTRAIELIQEGKEPDKAIKIASREEKKASPFKEEIKEMHAGFPFLNALFGDRTKPDSLPDPDFLNDSDEEVEKRMADAEGIKQSKGITRMLGNAKTAITDVHKAFRRTFPQLDPNKDQTHAVVNDLLRQLNATPAFAKAVAADKIAEITENLGKNRIKVFTRAIILPDIIKDIENGLYDGKELPFGFKNKAAVEASLKKYQDIAEAEPAIKDPLERREKFNQSITGELVDLGLLDDAVLDDSRYFHRQVMAYVQDPAFMGTGGTDVRVHKKGFQKGRVGGGDFNTRYVEAEHEWVAQAISLITRKETLDRIKQAADIKDNLILDAKARSKETGKQVDWTDIIPEGYTVWQPEKGNFFYPATSVTERTLDKILYGGAKLKPQEVKKVLAQGGAREQWVIPDGIAYTLERFAPPPSDNALENLWTSLQSTWKQWVLISPLRVLKYNLNNMSGDADIALAYDPQILKGFPAAARDLWRYQISGKGISDETKQDIQDAIKRGVVDSGLSISEIPDINKVGAFRMLTSDDPNLIQKGIQRFWNGTKGLTNWRENILRLTAYRYFKQKVEKGENVYGASTPKQIDAITDPDDKAAKLARELIGDYGAVSTAGQFIRRHMIPFYSWIEVNAPRYARMLRNVPYEEGKGKGARTAAVVAGRSTVGLVKLGVKVNLLFLLANLWNHLMFPDEEKELRGEGSRQNHLILGRYEDGSVRSIRVEGAFADALEWFGGDDYVHDIADLRSGKATATDKLAEAVKSPVNRIVNAWEPLSKSTFELVMGKSAFPSIFEKKADFSFKGRPIRDRYEYVARVFSLDGLYRRITGRPRPPADTNNPLGTFLDWTVAYRTNPAEAAYWEARGKVVDYQKARGKESQIPEPTDRANALYYYKQAVKWGDEKAAERYLKEYLELGGTEKGMEQSIKRSHPLGGLAQKDWNEYVESLDGEKRAELKAALDFYNKYYRPDDAVEVETKEPETQDLYKMLYPRPLETIAKPTTSVEQAAQIIENSDAKPGLKEAMLKELQRRVRSQFKSGSLSESERTAAESLGLKVPSQERNEMRHTRKEKSKERSEARKQKRLAIPAD